MDQRSSNQLEARGLNTLFYRFILANDFSLFVGIKIAKSFLSLLTYLTAATLSPDETNQLQVC